MNSIRLPAGWGWRAFHYNQIESDVKWAKDYRVIVISVNKPAVQPCMHACMAWGHAWDGEPEKFKFTLLHVLIFNPRH